MTEWETKSISRRTQYKIYSPRSRIRNHKSRRLVITRSTTKSQSQSIYIAVTNARLTTHVGKKGSKDKAKGNKNQSGSRQACLDFRIVSRAQVWRSCWYKTHVAFYASPTNITPMLKSVRRPTKIIRSRFGALCETPHALDDDRNIVGLYQVSTFPSPTIDLVANW